MRLHFPRGWSKNLHPERDDHAFAGPPVDAEGVLAELALYDTAAPQLRRYSKDIRQLGWLDEEDVDSGDAWSHNIVRLLHGYPQSSPALLRGSLSSEDIGQRKDARLDAWLSYLNWQSLQTKFSTRYEPGSLTVPCLREVARLSVHEDGPLRAVDYLRSMGIVVLIARAIPGTRVDGCAFWSLAKRPLIGLSVRHDRLDNFWFSLLHECAHVALHIKGPGHAFADDLDARDDLDETEVEANLAAADASVPRAMWKRSGASRWPNYENVMQLASEAGVHPSIVAGRVRYEMGRWTRFSDLLGQGEISRQFRLSS